MINFELIPAGTTLQTFDTGLPIRLGVCRGADRRRGFLSGLLYCFSNNTGCWK
jgi:hypothetical protein